MWKYFVREYLSFSKRERTGIIILLVIIITLTFAPLFYPIFIKHKIYDHSQFDKEIAQLKILKTDTSSDKKYYSKNYDENNYNNYYEPSEKNFSNASSVMFYFDPNTASAAQWKKLGVKDKTIATIQKYISKGGHFYKAEDIRKIWGIRPDLQERLIAYVRIENLEKQFSKDYDNYSENKPYDNTKTYKKPEIQNVEINFSDTSAFIALPGIGSKLAQRIITFRDKLGGFYSVDQVKETYGLPDSTFQKIRSKLILTNTTVKKININSASLDEMKSHPYLRYNLANAILQYRTQHGNFSSINDVKKIMIVTDEVFNKAAPYLSVN